MGSTRNHLSFVLPVPFGSIRPGAATRRQALDTGECYHARPLSDGDGPARLICASTAFIAPALTLLPAGTTQHARGYAMDLCFVENMTATPTSQTRLRDQSTRETPDAKRSRQEASQLARAVEESLASYEAEQERDRFSSLEELRARLQGVSVSPKWTVIHKEECSMFLNIIDYREPCLNASLTVFANLEVFACYQGSPIKNLGSAVVPDSVQKAAEDSRPFWRRAHVYKHTQPAERWQGPQTPEMNSEGADGKCGVIRPRRSHGPEAISGVLAARAAVRADACLLTWTGAIASVRHLGARAEEVGAGDAEE
ncbi:hypothetical protein HPB51_021211 [Rhipicephalus microplus]|uniref:Uncharacterized protein n=1 Tax=Rhipicephalus microplus TaxID=6941 RepID=A0A9J6F7J7_RHIMP|nr:hypothetical protein HPB51_021211 [Rhipicephalus microplus]